MRDDPHHCIECQYKEEASGGASCYCSKHATHLVWAGMDAGGPNYFFRCAPCMNAQYNVAAAPFDALASRVNLPEGMRHLARDLWISDALAQYDLHEGEDHAEVASVALVDALNSIVAAGNDRQIPQATADAIASMIVDAWSAIMDGKEADEDA